MKRKLCTLLLCIGGLTGAYVKSSAQITITQDYKNNFSPAIGTFQGINFREAGFSGLYPIPNTNGKEFWVCSDRGVNVDAANANPSGCTPTYDKIYGFPNYAPKIHRIRLNGDSIQILQTITMKRPGGTTATGILNPTGYGSTAIEEASTDTVLTCANYASKIAAKDIWGIDAEGIAVDKDGYFWICEEGGPTIWKLNQNGVVVKRYTPYAGMAGAQPIDVAIDTVFKYRKNNRGFEGITIAPNGKIYAIIQSPILYPTKTIGEGTRIHRILEIDPLSGVQRMFAYLNDGIIGASGSNQIRLRDWKIGDMAAINDSTFLVLEAAIRGTSDYRRVYKININAATAVHSGLYSGVTLEALVDSTGLAANSIVPVKKTLVMNLLSTGWDPALDKAEGLAILNDSTIFIGNDNDYGQYSPLENGIATATTNRSHVVRYRLQGSNKLTGFVPVTTTLSTTGITGPSTSRTPYLTPEQPGVLYTSLLTATETVGGYKMCGLPDGMGAFDNGDGTFTALINHEMGNGVGAVHAHGSIGAFVSKWVIRKSDFTVLSGSDLIQSVALWNPSTSSYITYSSSFPSTSAAFNRFCSADLPEVSAFYNSTTGMGTTARIFMNGEEAGNEGRAFGHVATGPNAGKSYELPYLGKFSWENSVASPKRSDTTVVIGLDDATPGQVYVYVGTKTNTGTEIEKAGLHGGKLYGVTVSGLTAEVSGSIPAAGTAFSLTDMGFVHNTTGATLNAASNTAGVTTFLRPEDGAWDPQNPDDFYFVTTNSFTSPSRLWKLHFTDAANPMLGGTITAVLDGTEGQKMLDNMAIDNYGHIILQEDPGNQTHMAKTWQYTIATDVLKLIGSQDSTRFLAGGANYLTQDEETSGAIDMEKILGPGMFMVVDQAHYSIPGDVVEDGQVLALFNPDTYNSAPEINVKGNTVNIVDGDATPSTSDNTDFGSVYTGLNVVKTFVIENNGQANLTVSGISFTGTHASNYTLVTPPTFPLSIASGSSHTISVRFTPSAGGVRNATINIANSDVTESLYDFALKGMGVDSPDINIKGNNVNIVDGDMTPGTTNHTDFGSIFTGTNVTKTFVIKNLGHGNLVVSAISFTGIYASEFTLVGGPTLPLAIADSYVLTVRFSPTAPGVRSAVVNVTSNDADEALYDFAIQGTGLALPEINVKGNGIAISDGDVTAGTANNTDMGSANLGSTVSRSFLIQNTGAGNLIISSIMFSGTHSSDFSLAGAAVYPITIDGYDSMMITVNFTPSAVGMRNANILINNNDGDENPFNYALQGNGNGVPEINVQGNSLNIFDGDVTAGTANNTDFGLTNEGTSLTKGFVIQNNGSGALSVTGISFSGANASEFTLFGAPTFPLSIPASGNQAITVQFLPTALGIRNATIAIASNDADEASYDFALQGTGASTAGVTTVSASTSLKLYPNPSSDAATIAIALNRDEHIVISITDMQGKQVLPTIDKELKAGQHLVDINTSALTNGIYFVKIADDNASTNIKLVVMH